MARLLAASAFAAVVVVIASSCSTPLPPSPTVSPTGEPTSSIAPEGFISWQQLADPQSLWSTPVFENLRGVVPFADGLLVYGYGNAGGDSGTQEAVIWLTSDVQTWTALSFDQAVGTDHSTSITEIAGNDQGLVAIGDLCCPDERVVWHSVDGASWTGAQVVGAGARPERFRIHGVAAASPGFVVVGEDHGSAAAWFSADGSTWARADDMGPGTIRDVAPFGTGFIAVGRLQDEPGPRSQWDAAVWVSEDGLSWTRVGQADALTAGDGELGWVVPFDGGVWTLGVVGEHGERLPCPDEGDCAWGREATWVGTLDLDSWEGPSFDAPRVVAAQNVIPWRGGLVTSDGDVLGSMWASADGLEWRHQPAPQPFPQGTMTALANLTDSSIVAIGNVDSENASDDDGAIWIGTYVND